MCQFEYERLEGNFQLLKPGIELVFVYQEQRLHMKGVVKLDYKIKNHKFRWPVHSINK